MRRPVALIAGPLTVSELARIANAFGAMFPDAQIEAAEHATMRLGRAPESVLWDLPSAFVITAES